MGSLQAEEMARLSENLEAGIAWHLQSNHYPPVSTSMVPVCIKAIDLANEGKWKEFVTLPEGVFWRGQYNAPVSAIVEQHHLDSWIEYEDL